MELRDALQRIVRQHWVLIAGLVAVGMLGGAWLGKHPSTYTASTRLVLGTDDPKSRTESLSIADTARAIATSPAEVRDALRDAHVDRDANNVAKNHVTVKALGTSSVMQLSVTDRNRYAAQSIANALANRVIGVRKEVVNGTLNQIVNDLAQRVANLGAKISSLQDTIDRLSLAAQSGSSSAARQRDAALRERDVLAQQRAALQSERLSIVSASALRPTASVISAAALPTHKDSSPIAQETVLGALLGLVLGIGIAGLKETFRPTLVGSDALAREFDTPLLGTIPMDEDERRARQALTGVALRLRLAAESVGADSVGLVPVGPHVELGLLAATLDELANGATMAETPRRIAAAEAFVPGRGRTAVSSDVAGSAAADKAPRGSTLRVRQFRMLDGRSEGGNRALVLVAPNVAKKDEVDEASHLLWVAAAPLLGLVAYERPRERRVVAFPRSASASR